MVSHGAVGSCLDHIRDLMHDWIHVLGAHRAVRKGMGMKPRAAILACVVLCLGGFTAPALAAPPPCGGDFGAWLDGVKQEAAGAGIPQGVIQSALADVTYDPAISARDHAQGVFPQTFEQFSGRMVPPRLSRGAKVLEKYAPVFSRIEAQYGVPGAVIVAIWGLA